MVTVNRRKKEMQVAYNELCQEASDVDLLARKKLWSEAAAYLEGRERPANEHRRGFIPEQAGRSTQDV